MKNIIASLTVLLLSVSCAHHSSSSAPVAPRYYVDVESLSDVTTVSKESVYVVESGMAEFKTSDIRFKNYTNVVYNVLNEAGFKTTTASKEATVKISLIYDIEKRVNNSSVTVPVYKQVGVNNVYGQKVGTLSGFDNQTIDTSSVDFKRWAILKAYDVKTGNNLWEVKASSIGPGHDLREVFPYLMLAMKEKLGTNGNEKVVVFEDEARASELRKPASLSK